MEDEILPNVESLSWLNARSLKGNQVFLITFLSLPTLYAFASIKVISQGTEALVERLGRYHRKLRPGLNFIVPILDRIVLLDSIRERILDIVPQAAITRDNVPVDVEAVIYWRILELELAYYAIEDVESAIADVVLSVIISEIGKMEIERTSSSRDELNRALLYELDEATEPWGIKVTRVEVQEISAPPAVQESMGQQRDSEIRKRVRVLDAEGEQAAAIKEAQGIAEAVRIIYEALPEKTSSSIILNHLLARRYVSANQKIGESENSKIIFMHPRIMNDSLDELLGHLNVKDFPDESP
jgi:regulator of protease activity HflC (stomatin/prohibitin superfamily)